MTNNTSSNSITLACIASVATISIMGLFTTGCENASQVEGVSWNQNPPAATTGTVIPPVATTDTAPPPSVDPGTGNITPPGVNPYLDAAPFSSFNWKYGGVNNGRAVHSGVNISGVQFSRNGLSFNYVNNLSAWGLSSGDISSIACLFVLNNAGQWVGGKFDWISSSRTTRDFINVYDGYNGWSLADVPNPCQAAFVIVNGSRRSNVIVGTWAR